MINTFDKLNCVGITLFKWGHRRAEVWFIKPGYVIEEHTHPKEDVELMYLFGSTVFYRRDLETDEVEFARPKFFRKFSVKHFHSHWFSVGWLPLVFINFQSFLDGHSPQSASKDFQLIS
jgi:hypothetical protein